MSEKARGKKRALEPEVDDDAIAQGSHLAMDLDDSGSASEDGRVGAAGRVNGQTTPSKRSSRSSNASTPSTSASATTTELGGSISRAARMRATTTEDEGGSGSDSASERDSDDLSDSHALPVHLTTPSKSARKTGASKSFVTASNGEAYLRAMSRPAKTSNKKLSEIWYSSSAPFTQASLLAALQAASTTAKAKAAEEKIRKLEDAYSALHNQWMFELEQGFSVFLYGLGSKMRVLQNFVDSYLKQRRKRNVRAIVINGFMATMGIDEVLSAFEDVLFGQTKDKDELAQLKMGKSAAKLDERTRQIVEAMHDAANQVSTIYLIVHNIDGVALRSFRAQAILSLLASQKQVRLLASFDHVKAPLLFPSDLASARGFSASSESDGETHLGASAGYNIIYHHTPTYRSYTTEALQSGIFSTLPPTLFMSDKASSLGAGLDGQSSEARAKAAYFVLASLTQKSKDVFILLAEKQMAASQDGRKRPTSLNREKPPPHATPYASLFSLARDRFLANNVNQFEALLREFRDHDVLLSSNAAAPDADRDELEDDAADRDEVGQRSNEWIWIAIEKEDLVDLVDRIRA